MLNIAQYLNFSITEEMKHPELPFEFVDTEEGLNRVVNEIRECL